jgi:aminoglycoside phosphotransferase
MIDQKTRPGNYLLTNPQSGSILSLFPLGTLIVGAEPMQVMQPCPVRVTVFDPGCGDVQQVVLRLSRNVGGVEREADVLSCLHKLGLPVPKLLAGPERDAEGNESFSVLEFLPGFTLQVLADSSAQGVSGANRLLVDGFSQLFELTPALLESPVADRLPRCSFYDEWTKLTEDSGDWGSVSLYKETLRQLEPLCLRESLTTPLVFSNGDYQPGNFLTDGEIITGFLDFEKAGFEDPLWTLARYPVYDLEPFHSRGLAQMILERLGFTETQFAVRVALFGLRTLRTKTSPDGTHNGALQDCVWKLVDRSLRQAEGLKP